MSAIPEYHKTAVLLTIDTEFSIGGYFANSENKPVSAEKIIYGRVDGSEYGINFIMDVLDRNGLKGVFFIETESRFYYGEELLQEIVQHIKQRGHEVQLHIHPAWRSFIDGREVSDDMRKHEEESQLAFIQQAIEFLGRCCAQEITAYRSGGFFSNLETLAALKRAGVNYVTNYNIAYPNCDYLEHFQNKNDVFSPDEDLYEFPVTSYKETSFRKTYNCLQNSAASYTEMKKSLEFYHKNKVQYCTFITHSFEFINRPKHDTQYNNISPAYKMARRFEQLCEYLGQNRDRYQVLGFNDIDNIDHQKSNHLFYKSGVVNTLSRYLENVSDRV